MNSKAPAEDTLLKRELQTNRFVKLMNTDINHKLDLINQRFEERMRLRKELAMAREE
jgi:cell shape-determining protein MreC